MTNAAELVSVDSAARELHTSRSTVWRLARLEAVLRTEWVEIEGRRVLRVPREDVELLRPRFWSHLDGDAR